jgi:hypothetical protein
MSIVEGISLPFRVGIAPNERRRPTPPSPAA